MRIYSIETSDYDQNRVLVKRKISNINTNGNTLFPSSRTNAYVVPKDKQEEFIPQFKRVSTKSTVLSALVFPFGIALGMLAGYKLPATRVDAKAWNFTYGTVAGFLLGFLGVDLIDKHYTKKLLKDFDAERISA